MIDSHVSERHGKNLHAGFEERKTLVESSLSKSKGEALAGRVVLSL
jgi:hypothetical protein